MRVSERGRVSTITIAVFIYNAVSRYMYRLA